MTERANLELDTLTIRIPIRLQRRGGRKLIMTPEGAAMPTMKPRPDETLIKALVRTHRWRRRIESGQAKVDHGSGRAGGRDGCVCVPVAPAHVSRAGHLRGHPGRHAAEGTEAG